MLQRSPSYIVSLPGVDPVARALRRRLPAKLAYHLIRLKQIAMTALSYQVSRRRPEVMKAFVRAGLRHQLPDGFDIDRHFKPTYDPWDQRLCVVPDGDLFRALRRGRASIVTDHIEAFTERGIRLQSGRELEADIIVTATGLNLQMLGGAQLLIDGRELDISQTVAYKGMMLSGVPNAAMSMGYTNASWTLKCDLICEYVCRLLAHMGERGYDYCVSVPPPEDEELEPLIDFNSGYVLRALDRLPKQGARPPWRLHQNSFKDVRTFRRAPLEDEAMRFGRVASAPAAGGTVTGDDPVDEFLAA
jgi:cation diffusion facilitator CzcD-associated flavoprotein CzcO